MLEILLLALALAADAFAASIGLGSTHRSDVKSQFMKNNASSLRIQALV